MEQQLDSPVPQMGRTVTEYRVRPPGGLLQDLLRGSSQQSPKLFESHNGAITCLREPGTPQAKVTAQVFGCGPRPLSVPMLPLHGSPGTGVSMVLSPSPRDWRSPSPRWNCSLSPTPGGSRGPRREPREPPWPTTLNEKFFGLVVRDGPWGANTSGAIGYCPCTVQLTEEALVIDPSGCECPGSASFLPHVLPWATIVEACMVEATGACQWQPDTHPCAVRIRSVHGCRGECPAEVDVQIALPTPAFSTRLLSAVRDKKRLQLARRCNLRADSPSAKEPSYIAMESVTAIVPCSSVQVASLSRKRYFWSEDGSPEVSPRVEDKPSCAMPLFACARSLEAQLGAASLAPPAPAEVLEAWIFWSRLEIDSDFQRCALRMDKLGLSARPLDVPDGSSSSRAPAELLHIPVTSILLVGKGTNPHTQPKDHSEVSWPPPPHPHIVGLEIRGVPIPARSRSRGSSKSGSRRPGGALKQTTAVMVLCFRIQDEANMVMQAIVEHRKHQLLATLRTSLVACAGEPYKKVGHTLGEGDKEGHNSPASRGRAQACYNALTPPSPSPRPSTLPPPHQLPQMVASTGGEVFWQLPAERPRAEGCQQVSNGAAGDATPASRQ